MREKRVKLSEQEHHLLKEIKEQKFESHSPFGFIIGELCREELK